MVNRIINIKVKGSIKKARLYTYFLDNSTEINPNKKRPVVVICPGGGYQMTSDREAEAIALKFIAMDIHAVVLRYSVAPAVYPTSLLELANTVKFLRLNSKKYNIDTNKIIIQGFSAGGHLAASLGVFWTKPFLAQSLNTSSETIKPNGLILSYPVITSGKFANRDSFYNLLGNKYNELKSSLSLEKQVNENTPKTFIWHTFTDNAVPVENSLLFVNALIKYNIPTEFHMYPVGGHGLSLANKMTVNSQGVGIEKQCQSWISLARTWIKYF